MTLMYWRGYRALTQTYDTPLDSYTAKQKSAAPSLFTSEESGDPPPPRDPLVDQTHRLMRIWETTQNEGALHGYFELRGLRNNPVFGKVPQALSSWPVRTIKSGGCWGTPRTR